MPSDAKLSLFIPSLSGGGAERVMVVLANEFATRGFAVDLVVGTVDGPLVELVSDRVNLVSLGSARVSRCIRPLASYLRRRQPSVLLSAMIHTNVAAAAAHFLVKSPARFVVAEHNALPGDATLTKARIARMAIRHAYRRADCIVAVSTGVAADLQRISKRVAGRVRVIHNPVVYSSILIRGEESIERGRPERKLILAAGRLVAQKDYPTLLRALSLVSPHHEADLVILGDGPLREELCQLATDLDLQERVSFPGFTPNPYAWMARCDVFALSSIKEGLPTVLIEAMALGAAVVSTDCRSGPAEVLCGGRFGELVPVEDPDALARAIERALERGPRPGARERANDFRVERAVDAYMTVFGC